MINNPIYPSDLIHFTPSLVLIGGPSGAGKTAIIDELIKSHANMYERPTSYTSRPRRNGESNKEYLFVNREDIYKLKDKGELLTIDEAYGSLYAMSKISIHEILSSNRIPIKEVHPKNFEKIEQLYQDFVSVLILSDAEHAIDQNDDFRARRIIEDREYYFNINLQKFDVVLRASQRTPLTDISDNLHLTLHALLSTLHRFPMPSLIDKTNAIGYTKVAPVFSEEQRITTRNFHQLSYSFFQKAIEENIEPGFRCLEIGPGHGWLRKNFLWPDVEYVSVDISEEMLKFSNSDLKINSSARMLNLPDRYFDAAFASLADPYCYPTALCEIRRVLKEQGLFIISSPSKYWSDGIRSGDQINKTNFLIDKGNHAEVFSFTFSIDELLELIQLCGFEPESYKVAYGSELTRDDCVSMSITRSADSLGIQVSELPILNLAIAKRK